MRMATAADGSGIAADGDLPRPLPGVVGRSQGDGFGVIDFPDVQAGERCRRHVAEGAVRPVVVVGVGVVAVEARRPMTRRS
jgi:hypothetical protein